MTDGGFVGGGSLTEQGTLKDIFGDRSPASIGLNTAWVGASDSSPDNIRDARHPA